MFDQWIHEVSPRTINIMMVETVDSECKVLTTFLSTTCGVVRLFLRRLLIGWWSFLFSAELFADNWVGVSDCHGKKFLLDQPRSLMVSWWSALIINNIKSLHVYALLGFIGIDLHWTKKMHISDINLKFRDQNFNIFIWSFILNI